ncbi:sugar phosphate isomerase/epimerase family protein [Paenibacillus koleovorans]|uniref:sugar phosphate isomerase/epimerase family protein n=1 Tax=Paenibacillus koleovorans TaxID=121608 RepID=UPI000FD879D5|nr:sugar phosphate isomerase/epimerase [Paenibacillus koleovorans]
MIRLTCMTLPYLKMPFERALAGIADAGYRYVSFGLPHDGKDVPEEQNARAADEIGALLARYRLEPVMLVSTNQIGPGQPIERARQRFEFAKTLGITELLSLGTLSYRNFPHDPLPEDELKRKNDAFVGKFRELAGLAEEFGIYVTIKPHTGNTATAKELLETLGEIGSSYVRASYDPGNVHFYEGIDPAADFPLIVRHTHSLVAKDHRGARAERDFPIPGEGDVDFGSIFRTLKAESFDGSVVVERIDGTDVTISPEETDRRIAQARNNMVRLLEQAGCNYE